MYPLLEKKDWKILSDLASEIASIVIADMDNGADDNRVQSYEEAALYQKLCDQIEFMEQKYGPHPIILDTKADFTDDINEKIELKRAAIQICLPNDNKLRGNILKDLSEIYLDEINDIAKAKQAITLAINDLKLDNDSNDIEDAFSIQKRILESEKLE